MGRSRVILADDHVLICEALVRLLEPEFEVVAIVHDGRALLTAVASLKPDVAVVDIAMPLLNGLDAGEQITKQSPQVKVVYLTQNRDPGLAGEAFRRGASGYLLKNSAASELMTAIRMALDGQFYVSAGLTRSFSGRVPAGEGCLDEIRLTLRQREVLQLLAEGRSMKQAADILGVTTRTVEFHKYRIMEVLKLENNAELIHYAIKHGMLAT